MKFLAFGALAIVSATSYSSLSNGSFQLGSGALADDWTLTGPNSLALTDTDYINNAGGAGASPYGGRFLSFNAADGAATNSASQTFATATGVTYTLSFAMANYGQSILQQLNVSLVDTTSSTGLATASYTDSTGSTDLSAIWTEDSLVFTALGATTTLTFTDSGSSTLSSDLLVDNVAVEAVPEPATMALLASGVALVARRRRR